MFRLLVDAKQQKLAADDHRSTMAIGADEQRALIERLQASPSLSDPIPSPSPRPSCALIERLQAEIDMLTRVRTSREDELELQGRALDAAKAAATKSAECEKAAERRSTATARAMKILATGWLAALILATGTSTMKIIECHGNVCMTQCPTNSNVCTR